MASSIQILLEISDIAEPEMVLPKESAKTLMSRTPPKSWADHNAAGRALFSDDVTASACVWKSTGGGERDQCWP